MIFLLSSKLFIFFFLNWTLILSIKTLIEKPPDFLTKSSAPSLSPNNSSISSSLEVKNITGKDADAALGRANITVNKNAVPNDPRSPFVTSGLRLGSPASTTRGFKEAEMRMVANWIADVLDCLGDESVVDAVREQVKALCARYPVYRSS